MNTPQTAAGRRRLRCDAIDEVIDICPPSARTAATARRDGDGASRPPPPLLPAAWVRLNVGGSIVMTMRSTLEAVPNSRLAIDARSGFAHVPRDATGLPYYARDPHTFTYILDFLRGYPVSVPPDDAAFAADDAVYFGLHDLASTIGLCAPTPATTIGGGEARRMKNDAGGGATTIDGGGGGGARAWDSAQRFQPGPGVTLRRPAPPPTRGAATNAPPTSVFRSHTATAFAGCGEDGLRALLPGRHRVTLGITDMKNYVLIGLVHRPQTTGPPPQAPTPHHRGDGDVVTGGALAADSEDRNEEYVRRFDGRPFSVAYSSLGSITVSGATVASDGSVFEEPPSALPTSMSSAVRGVRPAFPPLPRGGQLLVDVTVSRDRRQVDYAFSPLAQPVDPAAASSSHLANLVAAAAGLLPSDLASAAGGGGCVVYRGRFTHLDPLDMFVAVHLFGTASVSICRCEYTPLQDEALRQQPSASSSGADENDDADDADDDDDASRLGADRGVAQLGPFERRRRSVGAPTPARNGRRAGDDDDDEPGGGGRLVFTPANRLPGGR
jgi:hypothetical protein